MCHKVQVCNYFAMILRLDKSSAYKHSIPWLVAIMFNVGDFYIMLFGFLKDKTVNIYFINLYRHSTLDK